MSHPSLIQELEELRARVRRLEQDMAQRPGAILDALFAFVGVMTPEGVLMDANRAPLEAAGIERQDVLGKYFWQTHWFSHSDYERERLQLAIRRAQQGEASRYDADVLMKDGQIMTIDFMLNPVRDDAGTITHLIPSAVPITERKEAERALARQLRLTKAITDNTTTALFIMDERQHCVFMNPAAEELTGYTMEEVKGRPLHDVVHHTRPDGSPYPLEECPIDRAFPEHAKTKGEEVFVHKDGHFYEVAFTASPMRESGDVIGTVIEVVDIGDRKRREAERRKTEGLLNAVLDALPVSIIIADPKGQLVRMNPASERIWGKSAPMSASVDGYSEWIGYWPKSNERVQPHEWPLSRAVLNGKTVKDEQIEIQRFGDGERRVLELSAAPVRDERGAILGGVVASMDVTERVRAEQAVRESEATLNAVLDNLPVGVVISDKDGRLVRDNAAHRELWGIPPETSNWTEYSKWEGYWPDSGKRIEAHEWAMSRALLRGAVVKDELIECVPFGRKERRFYLNNAAPIRNASGAIIAGVAAELDVTDRKLAEEALRTSEEEFRTLANAIPQLCWMARPDGYIVWYNKRWYDYTGKTPEEMEGWGWESLHDPEILPAVKEQWLQAIATGSPLDLTFPLRGADGMLRPFLTRVMPVCDGNGRVLRWFGTNTDVSEQKRIETQLRRANQDLEQFAFSASHDLQEPLRNVSIYSQILLRKYAQALDTQGKEYLGYLVEGAQRMSQLVSDLLAYTEVAMVDPGLAGPERSEEVFGRAMETFRTKITETGATITHDPLPDVRTAGPHLQQLFQNLIGNALKYRNPDVAPEVHIAAYCSQGYCRFSLRDNGIGIDPQYHERIFGIFKRLHPHHGPYPGTGIGLAICQKIVERYGGRIWVDSAAGKGATFHFTLPSAT